MRVSFCHWAEENDPFQKEKEQRKLSFMLVKDFEKVCNFLLVLPRWLKSRFSSFRSAALRRVLGLLRDMTGAQSEVFLAVQSRKQTNSECDS